jgi:type II secretory pathway pseudopilin PulG
MHVHLPKPLHGWRAFVGEVGIIVLGVLIALGAEQLVEAVHWRQETQIAREALNAEASGNLISAAGRKRQQLASTAGLPRC